jgi:hypothetical protein
MARMACTIQASCTDRAGREVEGTEGKVRHYERWRHRLQLTFSLQVTCRDALHPRCRRSPLRLRYSGYCLYIPDHPRPDRAAISPLPDPPQSADTCNVVSSRIVSSGDMSSTRWQRWKWPIRLSLERSSLAVSAVLTRTSYICQVFIPRLANDQCYISRCKTESNGPHRPDSHVNDTVAYLRHGILSIPLH